MRVEIQVRGSSPDPYVVTFERLPAGIFAKCTCSAGLNGQACKHRISLLMGDVSSAVAPDVGALALVLSELPDTPLGTALEEVKQAEKALELAKVRATKAKKNLGRTMLLHAEE